ncbi:nickel pincer cofactor biosynthesis protein LarB [Weissella coleopterorum]|uniref:Nickel pincer cofactor biosynthesis protein LarB n=1 Tax=Weissella coleopterorum TaxID=2714949 RepID=A0A6G8B1P0_9LACO|nr:nickel pincer cofactor biosynthesis protein LarB [Weissella coleopterorum]QIL51135.1 nickel pincer cofactor biosynthesis protein LarB [Weissella coleopterorum]
MQKEQMTQILQAVAAQEIDVDQAQKKILNQGFTELDFAKIDFDRQKRTGYPEVIYGAGKTVTELKKIIFAMLEQNLPILVTRVDAMKAAILGEQFPTLHYNARAEVLATKPAQELVGKIAIVTAGTSDLKVAEEAAETALFLGNQVNRIYDVGVAGIHRLFARLDEIRAAQVVIVIAGMEGALASVVGGLVAKPVIAVPTSIGYGSNFGGMTALLTMLNSCASGITVVNIDNGFGAAYSASMINQIGVAK